ncbi:MAG TPA: hypothetical protein PLC53_02305 [Bacilli bacterium]|mgnify:CR=1 FL=1|nr:hypothetical protein [Bacilli bacterium]
MIEKIKKFNESNKNVFFFILTLILIGFIIFSRIYTANKTTECITPTYVVDESNNYTYEIKVKKDDEIIILSISKYGNKYHVEKTEKGLLTNYYIYYSDIYEEDSSGNYIIFRDKSFIDGIDNKYIYIEYLNEVFSDIVATEEDLGLCYANESFKACINEDDNAIYATLGDIEIDYVSFNVGVAKDFDINT